MDCLFPRFPPPIFFFFLLPSSDILQSYGVKKQLEHVWKSLVYNGDECSVHKPDFYRARFLKFTNGVVFRPDGKASCADATGPPFTLSLTSPLGLAICGRSGVYVSRVKSIGSAQSHTAIKVGCRILSIDGNSLTGKHKDDAVAMIQSAGSRAITIEFQADANAYARYQKQHEHM